MSQCIIITNNFCNAILLPLLKLGLWNREKWGKKKVVWVMQNGDALRWL